MLSLFLAVVGGIAAIICLIIAVVLTIKYILKVLKLNKKSVFAKSGVAMKALQELEKEAIDLKFEDLEKISEMKTTMSTSKSVSLVHESDGVYFKGYKNEDNKNIQRVYDKNNGIIIGN